MRTWEIYTHPQRNSRKIVRREDAARRVKLSLRDGLPLTLKPAFYSEKAAGLR